MFARGAKRRLLFAVPAIGVNGIFQTGVQLHRGVILFEGLVESIKARLMAEFMYLCDRRDDPLNGTVGDFRRARKLLSHAATGLK